jgi:hypothetical protein
MTDAVTSPPPLVAQETVLVEPVNTQTSDETLPVTQPVLTALEIKINKRFELVAKYLKLDNEKNKVRKELDQIESELRTECEHKNYEYDSGYEYRAYKCEICGVTS